MNAEIENYEHFILYTLLHMNSHHNYMNKHFHCDKRTNERTKENEKIKSENI